MLVHANRKRVFYLDLLKFVSIYAMIVCHLFYNYYSYTHESAQGMIPGLMSMENTLYLIAPGIFIFCLGGGLYLCRTKTWNYFVHRGFSLLAIGLILNVFRWLIPYWITRNPGPAEGFPDVIFYLLFNSDILFFAGLFFLLYGLLARLTDRLWIRFGILALLNIAGVFIPPVETASPRWNVILSNFIYVPQISIFQLFQWCVFPAAGYCFVKAERNASRKTRFVLLTAAGSGIVFLTVMFLLRSFGQNFEDHLFWYVDCNLWPTRLILLLCVTVFWTCLIWFLARLFRNEHVKDLISMVSRNLNRIYVIHWIVIAYGEIILFNKFGLTLRNYAFLIIAPIVVFVISVWLARVYEKAKMKFNEKRLPAS